MRYLTIALNAIFLVAVLVEAATNKTKLDGGDLLIILMLFAMPTVTLIYAIRGKDGSDWLSLYFRRKAAEERQRIRKIESNERI